MMATIYSIIDSVLDLPPYSMDAESKGAYFKQALNRLTRYHCENCVEYRKIAQLFRYDDTPKMAIEDLPFIPVRLFKEYALRSVAQDEIVKTMTSSGTSGQAVSRIFLDRATATNQTKVLVKIASSFTGKNRMPLLIVDSPSVLKDRNLFSARGAGILGFSMLGYDTTYLLDDDYNISFSRLDSFIEKHNGERILLFGFTFMVWQYLCEVLRKSGRKLDLEGVLIHGGGWKKLASLSVSNETFKLTMRDATGIDSIFNYYGMVEQTGSIFMECSQGHLHASNFSDILVRDPITFESLGAGKAGLLQLISLLPFSYPGHSLLSEDVGEIVGIDDCLCGRKGKYFHVHGRVKNAEVRGCSDVYTSHS